MKKYIYVNEYNSFLSILINIIIIVNYENEYITFRLVFKLGID